MPFMTLLPPDICERARQSRDPRFDGRFYVGVLTTGIYCRPVCPAKTPKSENVRFFSSGAAAQTAGFRPCMRCKPDLYAPASSGQQVSTPLSRALRHIEAGFLNAGTTTALAAEVGMGARQLNRLFADELGTTPLAVGRAVRLQLARRLMTNPALKLTEVAMHAGFGSIRRFNAEFQAVYQQPPGSVRQQLAAVADDGIQFSVPLREPYHRPWLMNFLAARTLDGMESVVDGVYRRRITLTGGGIGQVAAELGVNSLRVTIPAQSEMPVHAILRRLRRIFDLDADGAAIDEQLRQDPWLAPWLELAPGLRVPGAWDGYETAVRAILGQQVSVARARTIAQLFIDRIGGGTFPSPDVLAAADIANLGAMPGARCEAVRRLAAAVTAGDLQLDECQDAEALTTSLTAIKGIGEWTASYIAMRIARDPDTFLATDWVVRKALVDAPLGPRHQPALWQPWRSYAVMALWYKADAERQHTQHNRQKKAGEKKPDGVIR